MSVQKTNATKAVNNKAEKLATAVKQVFQSHTAKHGSKTLMSIAYSCTPVRP